MRKGHFFRLPFGRRAAAGLCAAALGGVAAPAHAAVAPMALPTLVVAISGCPLSAQPLSPAAAPAPAPSFTKTSALLGGAPSALEAMLAQQAAVAPVSAPAQVAAVAVNLPALTPGVDVSVAPKPSCTGFIASRVSPLTGMADPRLALPTDPEDFLASKRVRIARTNFDSDWNRVRSESISAGQLKRFVGSLPESRLESLVAVNRWVNQRITYAEDREQYGVADYWAGARRTLKTRRGDCEDIALTKMQLLAAAGVAREDMILTIARDLVRNADHAVLIVRTESGYRMLDNASDEVLDAAPQQDYRAILSFGNRTRWLHGV